MKLHVTGDRNTQPQVYYQFYLKPNKQGGKQKTHKHKKPHLVNTHREESTPLDIKRLLALHKMTKPLSKTTDKRIITKENDTKPSDSYHRETDTTATEEITNRDQLYTSGETFKQTNADKSTKDTPSYLETMYPMKTDKEESTKITETSHVKKRQKRFLSLFKKSEAVENDNFLFKILEFVNKNKKNVIPVFTVMREINTLVKSANGELNHSSKERNNYIGHNPPILPVVSYNLELGSDSKVKAFVKRLLGLKVEGDRLTIAGK